MKISVRFGNKHYVVSFQKSNLLVRFKHKLYCFGSLLSLSSKPPLPPPSLTLNLTLYTTELEGRFKRSNHRSCCI